jgi:hypothetical protein
MRHPANALILNPVSGRLLAVILFGAALIAAIPAHGEGRLEARYGVTMAGLSIGQASWTVDIGSDRYASSATGKASGLMSKLVSGEGTVSARGSVSQGRLTPASFVSTITHDGDKSDTKMVLDNGVVKDVSAESQKPVPDRVPVTEAHRQGIVDPVTALLMPMTGADGVSKEDCQRTLPVFDGRRRYDLKLTFKRMDQAKAERGYAGPVAVCAVSFQAKSGHRASSPLVKYLSEGREIELWLAPISGTRMLAPIRASFASMFGNLVIQAKQFDVARQTAAR